jgi:mannitol-1-phosphate/altronate dehydrogenase
VLVWTVNEKKSQKHFCCSMVDGIITDYITQANEVIDEIAVRTDLQRIVDSIRQLVS